MLHDMTKVSKHRNSIPTRVTLYQRSIVIGSILGDGYLYKDGRLQVEQSLQHQAYIKWLHEQLSTISGKLSSIERTHAKTGKVSKSCRFWTKKVFQDLQYVFYAEIDGKRTKVLPRNLEQFLDPIVLAIWFMDDGGKAQNTPKGAYINATSFTHQERVQIQQAFQNVFRFKITIQKAGGNKQYNFYIPVDSYTQFYTLVSPTILLVPTMMYKLAKP